MKKLFLLFFFSISIATTANSQELDVQVTGSGQKIILIPGLASSGEVWTETASQLSQNFECHVLTLPGFGGNPAADLSEGFLPLMESMIADYIQKQNQPVILIGHSLGGFLSLHLANSNPQLVKKVIIVDSFPFYSAAMNPNATAEGMKEMAGQMKKMLLGLSEEQYKAQQEASIATMTATPEKAPMITDWSLESDRNTVAEALYELMTTDFRQELGEVETPLLVLGAWYSAKSYGLTEEIVRKTYENQYQLASNVQIEMAPTAHHFIMWDNPEWFMEQVNAFLK
jgi:pimeloyl-ACP methyl ester carboxylesterase